MEDIALFELISHHVAHAVEQTQFTHRLERAIVDRTRSLEHEVAERRRGEKLQRALYEISALSVRSIKLDTFYAELHRIMGELLYAKNLIVTHFNETDNFISFPYYADEKDPAPPHDYRRPSGYGLTGFVMNTRMPQRIDQVRYQKLLDEGVLHSVIGSIDFNVWIGAPMIYQERLLGVIILQSYDITIGYDNDDLELLTFVADHIAAALSRKQTDDSLRSAHADLASSSNAIREKNCELERTLDDLRLTQNELMRQEKLASLGALVAGVAHEINTPIGIAITAASHLQDQAQRIANHRKSGNSTTSMLESFEPVASESCAMVLRNLRRADELIRSFKQVAVDQSSEQRRSFFLHSYLDEILISLQPQIKRARHKTFVQCPEEILLDTFPAAIYQTLVNLVMNSLVHGFEHMDEGEIRVEVSSDLDNVLLTYSDNGCGMTDDVVAHIFDPFFTTRRGRGGTGLGMHIVYNLVTQVLLGRIDVSSVLGEGTKIAINIPRTNPGCNKQPAAPSLA
ncbi:MAG: sensor histidine kinase [Arenimonas sp.]